MQTVCETKAFQSEALAIGLSQAEIARLVVALANDPEMGDLMAGTGGCRKLRWAGRGKGKSGGYRVVTFFTGADLPVFLITVFGKGEKANLTKAERNGLAVLTKTLTGDYRSKL